MGTGAGTCQLPHADKQETACKALKQGWSVGGPSHPCRDCELFQPSLVLIIEAADSCAVPRPAHLPAGMQSW